MVALAQSLVNVNSTYPLVVLITRDVGYKYIKLLTKPSLNIVRLEVIQRVPVPSTVKIGMAAWREALSKFKVFELVEYKKVLFLDGTQNSENIAKFIYDKTLIIY